MRQVSLTRLAANYRIETPPSRRWIFSSALAGVLVFAWLLPFWNQLHALGDEGIALVAAERWIGGDVPYRDFFEFVGPADLALTALGLKAFGVTVLGSRLPVLLAGGLLAAIGFGVSAFLGGGAAGMLAAGWFAVCVSQSLPFSNHLPFGHLFALASLAAGFSACRGSGRKVAIGLFTAGLLAGWTALIRIHLGAAIFAAGLATLILRPPESGRRTCFVYVIGFVAPAAGMAALFSFWGAAGAWLHCTIAYPLAGYLPFNRASFSVAPALAALVPGSGSTTAIVAGFTIFLLPFLAATGAGATVFRSKRLGPATVWLLLQSAGWYAPLVARVDIPHLAWASGAALVCAAGWWLGIAKDRAAGWRWAAVMPAICLLITFLRIEIPTALAWASWMRGAGVPWNCGRGIYRVDAPDHARNWNQMSRWVDSAGRDRVLFFPFIPLAYFCTGHRPPVRSSVLLAGYTEPQAIEEAARAVRNGNVDVVIASSEYRGSSELFHWFPAAPEALVRDNPLLRAINDSTTESDRNEDLILFRRR